MVQTSVQSLKVEKADPNNPQSLHPSDSLSRPILTEPTAETKQADPSVYVSQLIQEIYNESLMSLGNEEAG